jgi:high-affinity K+ transport system ATPase subunit B
MSMKAFSITAASISHPRVAVALLVCLIPTTIGGLLSAIGIRHRSPGAEERARDERPRC